MRNTIFTYGSLSAYITPLIKEPYIDKTSTYSPNQKKVKTSTRVFPLERRASS